MKKTINFISMLSLFLSFLFILKPEDVNAASASITLTSNRSSVVVGNTFTVTATVSSSVAIGSWDFTISYDTSKLSLQSSTANGQRAVGYADSSNKKSVSYTFTFKAKAAGNATISVQNAAVVDFNTEEYMSVTKGSKTVSVITQQQLEASYSKNNYLKSLSIEGIGLSPEFNKDVNEYTVELEPGTTEIVVNASAEDSKSKIKGSGKVSVTEGINKIEIVVTAENGSERKYIINATVKEYNPIVVTIDGKEYNVVRTKNTIEKPSTFEETVVTINGEEVPGFYSEITNITLLTLKNSEGVSNLYVYDITNETYKLYVETKFNQVTLYPKEFNNNELIPKGYKESSIEIDGNIIKSYKLPNSEFSLIYGLNLENNEEGLYLYDSKENTVQRYYTDEIEVLNNDVEKYNKLFLITSGAAIISGITAIILLISMLIRKPKTKTNIKEQVWQQN